MRTFDRTAKRVAAVGILAVLVAAGAGTLGAGKWLRQAFEQLFSDRAATAGLDLTTDSLDHDAAAGTRPDRPSAAQRHGARAKSGPRLLLLRRNEAWGTGTPATSSPLVPYAGFGIGVFKLSMNLAERDLGLTKEKKQRKTRVFAGLSYQAGPNLTLNLEYRALPAGDPLFTLDLRGLAFDVDNPFQNHNVNLKARYRF